MGLITVSTDRSRLDVPLIHSFLRESYWARNIPLETVRKSIEHSLCFGMYEDDEQVGFARAITDYTTFAYLADVFIVPEKRGEGLGKRLIASIMEHESLRGLKRWHLVTKDAQGLYARFGFKEPEFPERQMEIIVKNIYGG